MSLKYSIYILTRKTSTAFFQSCLRKNKHFSHTNSLSCPCIDIIVFQNKNEFVRENIHKKEDTVSTLLIPYPEIWKTSFQERGYDPNLRTLSFPTTREVFVYLCTLLPRKGVVIRVSLNQGLHGHHFEHSMLAGFATKQMGGVRLSINERNMHINRNNEKKSRPRKGNLLYPRLVAKLVPSQGTSATVGLPDLREDFLKAERYFSFEKFE